MEDLPQDPEDFRAKLEAKLAELSPDERSKLEESLAAPLAMRDSSPFVRVTESVG